MSSNLINKLNGMDISDMKLKDMIQNKEWKDVIKKIEVIIAEMNPDTLSYCQDKISNIYDKYLNIEGNQIMKKQQRYLRMIWKEIMDLHGYVWLERTSHSISNRRKKHVSIAILVNLVFYYINVNFYKTVFRLLIIKTIKTLL